MATKATIFKAELQIADMDRHYYATHALTLAQHPSETDERMMVRVLAFARHASDTLNFTKGISTDDEPDLWRKDLVGTIEVWIDLGQPDEKRIRKACGRAQHVIIYCHSGHSAELWWQKTQDKLTRFENLTVINLVAEATQAFAKLTQRSMQLQCSIQDGQMFFSTDSASITFEPVVWKQGK